MTEFSQLMTTNDIEALGTHIDRFSEYDESIETASEDSLRNWLIASGYTPDELDVLVSSGFTIREMAENLQIQGHTFP